MEQHTTTSTETHPRTLVHVSIPSSIARPAYEHLPELRTRFTGVDLVTSAELWPQKDKPWYVSSGDYQQGWAAHLTRLSGLLVLTGHAGTYGTGITREIRQARDHGLQILLLTPRNQVVDLTDCTLTEIDGGRRAWQKITLRIDVPPATEQITPAAAVSLRELGLDPEIVAVTPPKKTAKRRYWDNRKARTKAKALAESVAEAKVETKVEAKVGSVVESPTPDPASVPVVVTSSAPAPRPSMCWCRHPRIAHSGGQACRLCVCGAFQT